MLSIGSRRVAGRRATSCLVEPAPEDLVLAVEADGETYVLAVLDRPDGAGAVLSVPGASSATLAQDRLGLRCETLSVDAGTATLRSRVAQVTNTRAPRLARPWAARAPAGPAPTTTTSQQVELGNP